jgi:hypothetical protein
MEVLHQNRVLQEQVNNFKSEHSLNLSVPVQYQFQNIGSLRPNEIQTLNEIKAMTIQLINANPRLSRNEYITILTKQPDFFNIMQTQLPIVDHLFAD